MAKQLLDGADVIVILQQVRREAVAKGVAGHALLQAGGTGGGADSPLQAAFVEVMAARGPRPFPLPHPDSRIGAVGGIFPVTS